MNGITPDGLASCSPERTQQNKVQRNIQDKTRYSIVV